MTIKTNLLRIQERIQKALARAGRNPSELAIVFVTKNVPVERMKEAFEAGCRDFGENRVQELLRKKPHLDPAIHWHFVGHLQTNKVKSMLGEIVLLHSLDRLALADEIQKQAERKNLRMNALIQVNTTGEASKSGFPAEVMEEIVGELKNYPQIHTQGLMTIGPLGGDERRVRESFERLRLLRDKLQKNFPEVGIHHLSMGMSSDFEIAIEEGATMIRIGSAVFGERKECG